MAKKVWDFECPQYVDFEQELDNSGKDDTFFEQKEKSSEIKSLHTPEVQGKAKGLTDSDENKLLGKMTAALSLLENTPKVKKSASRGKLFSEKSSRDVVAKLSKSTVKLHTVPAPRLKFRRSKSLDHLNKIISGKTNKEKCRLRKSSSLNDLRIHNKLKYPITPMCLKRTIVKAKEKVIKTTEEMELEQIAKLQKQLIMHLRQNEISLRKLNLRPRQCTTSKAVLKPDNVKDLKGRRTLVEKSNIVEKEPRNTVHILNQRATKKEVSKLEKTTNNENFSCKKTENPIHSRKSKVTTVDLDANDCILNQAAVSEKASKLNTTIHSKTESDKKTGTLYTKKAKSISVSTEGMIVNEPINQKTKKSRHTRIMDHSGLIFVPSVKSNTAVKPFIFEAKTKEVISQIVGAKLKEVSILNHKENDDKENDCFVTQSAIKKIQNAKCNATKLAEASKIAGKKNANLLRGIPLAENVNRN